LADTLQARSHAVTVAGVRSPVIEAGPPEQSEAVVFVHGNPGAGHDWDDLIGRVSGFARVVAPTMPGFGEADKPADFAYTVEGYARHLGGILDQLGVRRAHLVLHDFGGPWGLAWGLSNPDAWASVTLINIGVLVGYRWHTFARIWRTPVLGELFQLTSTRRGVQTIVGRQNPRLSKADLNRIYDQSRGWPTKRAVLKLYRATEPDFAEARVPEFARLDVPALAIWGAADPYLPVAQADVQQRAFPRVRVEILPGAGHWAIWEDPERVAGLVVPFLQQQLARQSA
jgi:pimeloyl-ACP methyl ester carboxylesterase